MAARKVGGDRTAGRLMAALDVEFEAVSDVEGKFARLAQLLGLADADHARGKVEHLWMACTTRGEADLPQWLVEKHLGAGGPGALVEAELGSWGPGRGDSSTRRIRISGAEKRCLWMRSSYEQSSKGGKSRAATASRAGGRFTSRRLVESDQPKPAPSPSPSPSPSPEEDLSPPARAIPGTPEPAPTTPPPGPSVPAASPPAPAREDIARTQAIAGDQLEASKSRCAPAISSTWTDQRPADPTSTSRPVETTLRASPPPAPIAPFDPNDPRAIGRLAEAFYQRVSAARIVMAAELKLPEPLPFPLITPATRTRGFVELSARIREEGPLAPAACERVLENAVKQARAKRSIDWLGERLFGDKAWGNARDGIDPSARPPVPRRGDPQPPATAPQRPERPPPDPVISPEDLAAMRAQAALAATAPERGREIASLPTAELVKRFGDGQRAPPQGAFPDDETPPDKQHRRKAAT